MAKVPNAVEILQKIWTAWVGHTSVTDDRQTTDGRAIAYSEREREFTSANKIGAMGDVGATVPAYFSMTGF